MWTDWTSPYPGQSREMTTELEHSRDTHLDAYLDGRRLCCMSGCRAVRVYAPDGTVAHEWSSKDNVWHAHVGRPL